MVRIHAGPHKVVEMIYTVDVGGEVRVTLGGIERQHLSESCRGVHDVIFVDRSFRSMNPPIFYCDKGIPASMYRLVHSATQEVNICRCQRPQQLAFRQSLWFCADD